MPENSRQSTDLNQQARWAANLKKQKNQIKRQTPENLPINLRPQIGDKTAEENQNIPFEKYGIRRQLEQARKLRRAEIKMKKEGQPITEIKKKSATMFTANLLKWSWTSLVASYGLTLIYINFHFLMVYLLKSQYFCPFGTEWFGQVGQLTNKNKLAGGALSIGEILLLAFLDCVILSIIGIIVYLITQMAENSLIFKLISFLNEYLGGATNFLQP